MIFRILREWWRWHDKWDDLCTCCGKCCYDRRVMKDGEVVINYLMPCENLDPKTNLCRIYSDRLKKCDHCKKVTLFTALFNPTLPLDCPYVTTFRMWKKKEKK